VPTAVLFPGQGSQTADLRDVAVAGAPDLAALAAELVGEDPFARIAESTRFAQPAIFCASLAGWRRLAPGLDVAAVAGHSLGELAALAAAGAVGEEDALRLVVERGRLMAEAGERAGGGTMLALLGAGEDAAERLAAAHGVVVANLNAPGQVVLSGAVDALAAARAAARAAGLRALDLGVAGAFHSPQMATAVAPFAAALRRVAWRTPRIAVLSCATARPFADPAVELAAALTLPVRWTDTLRALARRGVDDFVDAGPGDVLAKLVRRTLPAPPREAVGA